jgi:hypothetical protein
VAEVIMGEPFIVQLANRPGELAHLTRALAARGIDINYISGSGAGDLACALLTTDDDVATGEVLRSMGVTFVTGSTLIVEVPDRPGELAKLTERLGREGVNIQGFCIIGHRAGMAEVAFSVDDEPKARRILGLPPVYQLATT